MSKYGTGYSNAYDKDGLLDSLLASADLEFNISADAAPQHIVEWAKALSLGGRPFKVEGHEYQMEILESNAQRMCLKKGAQMGFSETQILKSLHGMLSSRYLSGVLYLFPTANDVVDFSRGRFAPLIAENHDLSLQVKDTDATSIKRIKSSMLYLRGARATSRIEGLKKSSSQLKSIPVDRIVFDEVDEMDPAMIDLALERFAHSEVQEESYLSTPSIPDFGIDKLYTESDQRVWMIKCEGCGTETCLELEFPNSLLELSSGHVIRCCKKCKREIFPRNGRWVALHPERSQDKVGYWISQLNSAYVDPQKILRAFREPPNGNISEVYNSKLAMAHVAADNRLSAQDVYACCGQDVMSLRDPGPCAMGVDVGKHLHVVVGFKDGKRHQIIYLARVSSFNDVHDIAKRFRVDAAVIDMEPETRKVREFQAAEPFPVFLADYQEVSGGEAWDMDRKMLKVRRTEICDRSHEEIVSGRLILPRQCEEVEIFAKECSNLVKVLEENDLGSREYRYRKTGEDHYRHALGYFLLAAHRISATHSWSVRGDEPVVQRDIDWDPRTYDDESPMDRWVPYQRGFSDVKMDFDPRR